MTLEDCLHVDSPHHFKKIKKLNLLGIKTRNCLSLMASIILLATSSGVKEGVIQGRLTVTPLNKLVEICPGQTQHTVIPVLSRDLSSETKDSANPYTADLEAQ